MSFHGGIEIDGKQLRATVIEGSPKKYRVVDFIEGEITGETEEEQRAALRGLLAPGFLGKDRVGLDVAASIGADRAILREISVPYTKDEIIAKTIRFESESYIFSHTIEELIIEHLKCGETDSGSRLILCAVEKDHIAADLERLQGVDIDPVNIELNATALATAYAKTDENADQGNTLLVQIEGQHTTFVLMEEGRISKIRSVWNVVRPIETTAPLLAPGEREDFEADATDSPEEIEDRFAKIERSLSGLEESPTPPESPATASSPAPSALAGLEPTPSAMDSAAEDDDEETVYAVLDDDDFARISSGQSPLISPAGSAGLAVPAEGLTTDSISGTATAPVAGAVSALEPDLGGEPEEPASGDESGAAEKSSGAFVLAPVTDPFDRIVLELERTFAGYLLGGSIERIVVTGNEAASMDAVTRLSEQFEVAATELDLGSADSAMGPTDSEAFCRGGAVSFGLALRTLGLASTPFELRKEEYRFERRFERLMPSLTLVSLLLCMISLVWMVDQHREAKTLDLEVQELREHQSEMFAAFFGEAPRDSRRGIPSMAQEKLRNYSGSKSGGGGGARLPQYLGAVGMFQDFYTAVSRVNPRVYPDYTSFDFNPYKKDRQKSTVKLLIKESKDVQLVVDAVRQHTKFFDVQPSQREGRNNTGVNLTLELLYKETTGGTR